jgi:hypothetical protein
MTLEEISHLPSAPFCWLKDLKDKDGDIFFICEKHGVMAEPPVVYVSAGVSWKACPTCVIDFCGKPVQAAPLDLEDDEEVADECNLCDAKDQLKNCDICGTTVCPTHMNQGSCSDCAESFEGGLFGRRGIF